MNPPKPMINCVFEKTFIKRMYKISTTIGALRFAADELRKYGNFRESLSVSSDDDACVSYYKINHIYDENEVIAYITEIINQYFEDANDEENDFGEYDLDMLGGHYYDKCDLSEDEQWVVVEVQTNQRIDQFIYDEKDAAEVADFYNEMTFKELVKPTIVVFDSEVDQIKIQLIRDQFEADSKKYKPMKMTEYLKHKQS